MKTKIIISIISASLVAVIAWVLFQNKQEINAQSQVKQLDFAIPVKVDSVRENIISDPLVTTGEFQGWEEVSLVAESQGSIEYLNFSEGDLIKKGQAIAKIDAISLNSQLATAQSSYAKSEKDVARYERLEKAGAVSKTQLEDIRIQMENARASIAQIQQQLSFTIVKSPIDGVVNQLLVEENSFVMPGNKIAEIVQVSRLKIIVNVSENDLAKIEEGQEATIRTDVFPLAEFKGSIANISVKADDSRKFKVTIVVENTNKKLRAGMFADVRFNDVKNQGQTALVIPREAIVGSLQSPSVYLVENNIAKLTKIEAGAAINGQVVMLSGLKAGDQVVTGGIINLEDNSKVKITK